MPPTPHVPTTTEAGSLWLQDASGERHPRVSGTVEVDVAVVGGGIAGIATAILLKEAGATVAVVEAERVGGGVTGANTAKASALQATLLQQVRSRQGPEGAAAYAAGSLAGVELIASLAARHGVQCDLERLEAATYAATADELEAIHREAEVAGEAGLAVEVRDTLDVPYPVAGAVVLADQLGVQPVRWSRGLAAAITGGGSHVFEQSRVLRVEAGSPCRVHTADGIVSCAQVVIATHFPMLDRGVWFARLEAVRSYCIAARVKGSMPRAMSISAGETIRSVRSFGEQLVLGGESHSVGSSEATPERFAALEAFARQHWAVEAVTHRWSAQDLMPYDRLPVIGAYHPRSSRLFVAAGFMKWGLSGGAMAGLALAPALAGGDRPEWSRAFEPNRLSLRSVPTLARMNAKVGLDMVGDRLRRAQEPDAAAVPPGEGRVVRDGLGKVGVYVDADGGRHAVSLRCTHLGCLLRWNGAERSWDCPCHGSRFDVDGAVLEGPATRPLKRRDA